MKKRITSILLALCLCLTLLPTAALATGEDKGTTTYDLWESGGTVYYGTYNGGNPTDSTPLALTTIFSSTAAYSLPAGSYRLADDIKPDSALSITGTVTLDLNGKTLTAYMVVGAENESDLTIKDSVGGGTLTRSELTTLEIAKGSVTLESGTVSAGIAGVAYAININRNCCLYAHGGTVSGPINVQAGCSIEHNEAAAGTTVFTGDVQNDGFENATISGGIFQGAVTNYGTITGGTFYGTVNNGDAQHSGTITGGTFYGTVINNTSDKIGIINSTNGSVINNGVFQFDSGYKVNDAPITGDDIENLSLSGTGYVQVGSGESATYYTNTGTPLTVVIPPEDKDGNKILALDASKSDPAPKDPGEPDDPNAPVVPSHWDDTTGGWKWEVVTDSETNETTGTLTLKNVVVSGRLALPADATIVIQGTVVVEMIGGNDYTGPLTIKGEGTDPSLHVTNQISLGNAQAVTLEALTANIKGLYIANPQAHLTMKNAEIYARNMNLTDDSGNTKYGLKLENSEFKICDYFFGGYIELDDDSILRLLNCYVCNYGNITDGLNKLEDFLPEGYRISGKGEFDVSPYSIGGYTIVAPDGKPARNLTLMLYPVEREVPFTVIVNQGGTVAPEATKFGLKASVYADFMTRMDEEDGNVSADEVTASVGVNGNGTLTVKADRRSNFEKLFWKIEHNDGGSNNSEPIGIYVRENDDEPEEGWEYAEELYYLTSAGQESVCPPTEKEGPSTTAEEAPNEQTPVFMIGENPIYLYKVTVENTETEPDKEANYVIKTAEPVTTMTFTNTYTENNETTPSGDSGVTRYTITATAGEGGSISPTGRVRVTRGSDKTFTIAPAKGYRVSDVLVDGKSVGPRTGYTFKTVKTNHTIEAVFEAASNIPSGLNSTDHVAFVQGFADGLVRPNANITRAQTAVMLYRLLTPERRAAIETDSHPFTDVTAADWYSHEVATMTNGGYISGYSDGTFRGNDPITRAQFVAILVRFLGLRDVTCDFTDVPASHWAYQYIATAVNAGWIGGFEDGTFRPDQSITRAQVMAIINRALDRGVSAESALVSGWKNFPDNPATAWHYYEVIEATNGHDYTGHRPNENWTALK